jgi:RHS repeat-associated protein
MKIRQEQMEAMAGPSTTFRKELCALLNEQGIGASLDSEVGDLTLPGLSEGTARISFDKKGRPATARTSGGRLYRFEYDENHRPSAIVDTAGNKVALQFDQLSHLTALTQPSGMRYEFLYERGLPVEIRRSGAIPLRFRYDGHGNLSALVDGKSRSQSFQYDPNGRLSAFSDRLGQITQYSYGQDGLLSSITTPTRSVWRSAYDDNSQRSSIFYPDGTFEEHRPGSSPTLFRRRDGKVAYLAYDSALNVIQAKYPGDLTVQLSYSKLGHLSSASNGIHDFKIEYNDLGYRSVEEVDGRRVRLEVDEDQLLRVLENHRHERVTFDYGADQRISRIHDWDRRSYGLSWDADGRLIGVDFPNGTSLRQAFAPHGTLQLQTLTRPGRGDLNRSYQYDANDVLIGVSDSGHGPKKHETDAEDRLTAVSSRYFQREYKYDAHGNLLSVNDRRYAYDSLDQISESTDGERRYDHLGNLAEWGKDGRAFRYFYNGQNQLVRVERSDGRVAEYEYDALGRRIVKRFGGVTTTFTWWGDQIIAEDTDGQRSQHVDYLFLPGTCRLLAMRVNGTTYYAQTDHLECPIRLIDGAGQIVWTAEPHGYEYPVLISQVKQPFRFPGQYFDEESGLHYNRHRYYDPITGRYLSPDPLFFKDRTNRYLYAGGNPAQFCDPSGLFLPLLVIGGALLLGAVLGAGHSIASDLSQGRSVNWGNAAKAAGMGALVAAGGLAAAAIAVATLPVTAPAAAVLAIGAGGALLTGAVIAGVQAPEGQGIVACAEAIPFVRQFTHDYEHDPSLKYPLAQRVVDGAFDLLTLGLMAKGARAVRGTTVGDMRAMATGTGQPRPKWRDSERDVETRRQAQGFNRQQSFKNGKTAKYGEKGSVRPDLYKTGRSIEIKNYDVMTEEGRARLVKNVTEQAKARATHLPPNTVQEVVLDVRGQTIARGTLNQLVKDIAAKSGGVLNPANITVLRR